jgi:hypothetical protein
MIGFNSDIPTIYVGPASGKGTFGYVGIGTTNPQSELSVNGKITAKEIEVLITGWPDFVFENNYKLKSLQEVESFISANGHLPNVPSAKEVEEGGINLGKLNATLLQKIEELTLYVIDQNKEIEKLKQNCK